MKFNTDFSRLTNPWVASIIIAVLVLIVYSNVYQVPFVFDGKVQIEKKEKIRDVNNYLSLKGFFSSHRPLVSFSYALNYRMGKLNVFGYHLVNNIIHVINGILAYFIALNVFWRLAFFKVRSLEGNKQRISVKKRKISQKQQEKEKSESLMIHLMAFMSAIIFATHPVMTQGVTYMGQRYTCMSAMFYLISVLMYIIARKEQLSKKKDQLNLTSENSLEKGNLSITFTPKILGFFFLSFCSGALALLCKENAATLFGAILLVEYFAFDRTWSGWKKKLIWLLPLCLLVTFSILYFFAASRGMKLGNLLEDVSVLTRETRSVDRWSYFCTQLNVLVIYVRLLFFPVGQNLDHLYPFKAGLFDDFTFLALLFVLSLLAIGFWSVKRKPALSFGIFWFFITLSIESSIFPISDAMFEHRLYLPSFGFAVAVVDIIFGFLSRSKFWLGLTCVTLAVTLSVSTYLRNKVWLDPVKLWTDVTEKNPENYRGYNNLGASLNDQGQIPSAIRAYQKALNLKPDFPDAHSSLGSVLLRQGRIKEAIGHLETALRLNPRSASAYNSMGVAMAMNKEWNKALNYFRKALSIHPNSEEIHNSMANIFASMGKMDKAISHWSKAIEINENYASPHYNMGVVLLERGEEKKAEIHFKAAVDIKSDYAEAYEKLGLIARKRGDNKAAMRYFSEALRFKPDLPEARQAFRELLLIKSGKK